MSGELINLDGESGWVTVGSGLSLTAGNFVQASADDFDTLFAAVEEDYKFFVCRLQITGGTPTENNRVEVHLRMGDGTNQEPVPSGDYAPHLVGGITLDNTAASYYFGTNEMALLSKKATIYLKSNEASATLTATLSIMAKSLTAAA